SRLGSKRAIVRPTLVIEALLDRMHEARDLAPGAGTLDGTIDRSEIVDRVPRLRLESERTNAPRPEDLAERIGDVAHERLHSREDLRISTRRILDLSRLRHPTEDHHALTV